MLIKDPRHIVEICARLGALLRGCDQRGEAWWLITRMAKLGSSGLPEALMGAYGGADRRVCLLRSVCSDRDFALVIIDAVEQAHGKSAAPEWPRPTGGDPTRLTALIEAAISATNAIADVRGPSMKEGQRCRSELASMAQSLHGVDAGMLANDLAVHCGRRPDLDWLRLPPDPIADDSPWVGVSPNKWPLVAYAMSDPKFGPLELVMVRASLDMAFQGVPKQVSEGEWVALWVRAFKEPGIERALEVWDTAKRSCHADWAKFNPFKTAWGGGLK